MLLDGIHPEPTEYHLQKEEYCWAEWQAAPQAQTPVSGRLANNTQLARWALQGEAGNYGLSKTRQHQWLAASLLPAHQADTGIEHL